MIQYRFTLEGQVFDVKVLDNPRREQVRVEVNGEIFTVQVGAVSDLARETTGETVGVPALPTPAATGAAKTGGTLTAPLPGVVKSIAVRTGQHVVADDELLVIEAMKMDNVIRASAKGTIGAIHVTAGRRVAYGEPLLDLKAEG